jgi:hypothetical protein
MKRRIYTFLLCIQTLVFIMPFTACNDEETGGVTGSQNELIPSFAWDRETTPIQIQLETDNGWCITRYNNSIALSNFDLKCQYLLTWDGDMSASEKENVVFKIAEVGKPLQTLRLDYMHIERPAGFYRITFGQGNRTGELIITK